MSPQLVTVAHLCPFPLQFTFTAPSSNQRGSISPRAASTVSQPFTPSPLLLPAPPHCHSRPQRLGSSPSQILCRWMNLHGALAIAAHRLCSWFPPRFYTVICAPAPL
ncbi:hypothetical protein B0H10DRAFT_2213856 [Mycena sp. CBHHK59/15]|nr:hypothetical protein B0H10DRAFT_2213856 [Mycena sp. CBHHK59/15]